MDTIAALGIMQSANDYAAQGIGMVQAVLSMDHGVDEWMGMAPERVLMDALQSGSVAASGKRIVLYAGPAKGTYLPSKLEREGIAPDEWQDMFFYDAGPPYENATTAYPNGHISGTKAVAGFTDILFSRSDLTTVFPGEGANQIVRLVPVVTAGPRAEAPSWRVQIGEQQQAWVWRADVVLEAEQRRGSATSEAKLCAALAEMARESGHQWSGESIAATRRRTS